MSSDVFHRTKSSVHPRRGADLLRFNFPIRAPSRLLEVTDARVGNDAATVAAGAHCRTKLNFDGQNVLETIKPIGVFAKFSLVD